MNEKYTSIANKIRRIIKYLRNEYLSIIKAYEEDNIYKKSYPICANSKSNRTQEEQINNIIKNIFNPAFNSLSPLIDKGIIELESPLNETFLEKNINNKEVLNLLLEEGCERLFIFKYIRYNLCLSFIMQLYLIFEKEIVYSIKKDIEDSFDLLTLFSAINFIEKNKKTKIDNNIKDTLNLYRNVINVFKHGNGISYEEIKNKYNFVLNDYININYFDSAFIFNLDKIDFEDLYKTICSFLDEVEK